MAPGYAAKAQHLMQQPAELLQQTLSLEMDLHASIANILDADQWSQWRQFVRAEKRLHPRGISECPLPTIGLVLCGLARRSATVCCRPKAEKPSCSS
ncbi:MAG: hypothetical protein ACSHXK_04805 [Oceanococcus sp.]